MRSRAADNKSAVIFGAQHPTGLHTARALRDCGLDIIGFHFSDSPCLYSNIWNQLIRVEKTAESIVSHLQLLSEAGGVDLLLFPADDECVKILSDNREKLPSACKMILPEAEIVDLLLDKSKFYTWAESHGFAFPATSKVQNFEELNSVIAELGYPLLLKPLYRSAIWDKNFPADKVFILNDAEHFASLPRHIFEVASPILVQQYVPGDDSDIYFCLVQYNSRGKLVDYFCGRKLMQWPPLGGSTAIAVNDELDLSKEITLAIFNELNYIGLGSIEYKRDPRDGKLLIMEPTVGRNDFQSYLAFSGGVNLTRNVCKEMLGLNATPITHRRPSVWICEPSMWYGIKYYVRNGDFYFLKYVRCLFRSPGFAYLSKRDRKPFMQLVKSRLL